MQVLAIILLALVVIIYGLRIAARTPPASLAKFIKTGGGLAILGLAGLMAMRGRIDFAAAIGGVGLWLLGMGAAPGWTKMFRNAGASSQGKSRVRSAMIEMELDHESGALEGLVLAGKFEGKQLSELPRPLCEELYRTCLADDPDGARLLEAYLDRRFPGWRPAADGDAHARSRSAHRSGSMSEDEAYEILGLQKGASPEDVARAHRTLMKKLHPDHGGSTNLAARVNEAKEILMRRHSS